MKKIPELSKWMEQYQGNPDFYALLEDYEKTLEQLEEARENKRAAKEAYQLAMESADLSEYERLSLLTRFRQTKYLYMAEKAAFQLTKYALEHWIDAQTGGKGKPPGKKKK